MTLHQKCWLDGDVTHTPDVSHLELSSPWMLLLAALSALVAVHRHCAAQQKWRCSAPFYRVEMRQTSSWRTRIVQWVGKCERGAVRTISPARSIVVERCFRCNSYRMRFQEEKVHTYQTSVCVC